MQIYRSRGDTKPVEIVVSNGSIPLNLTGATLVMTVNSLRNPPDASTQIYQVVGVVSDPASGAVTFTPAVSDVDLVGFYYYDIQHTDSNGVISTLVKDAISYSQDITK